MRFLNLCATLAIGLISPSIAQKPGDWADIPSGSWGVIRPRNFNGDYSCLDKRGYLTESDCAVFVANNGHFHLGVDSSAWLSFDQRDKRSLTVSGSPTAGVWKANKINVFSQSLTGAHLDQAILTAVTTRNLRSSRVPAIWCRNVGQPLSCTPQMD